VATSPTAAGPLFGLVLVLGVARAFVAPAARSLPADIVPAAQLPWLVARWTIVFQVALIIGPVMAGSLYAVDPQLPFGAAAILFLLAAISVSLVSRSVADKAKASAAAAKSAETASALASGASPAGRLHEALGGLRLVRQTPILLGAISLDLFAVLFGGAVALLPAIADERLGVGSVGFGWLRAAPGIGAALMMLSLAIRPVSRHVGRKLLATVGIFGLGTIALGITTNYVIAFLALVVLAGADALSVFIRITLVPLTTPASARGRVMAVENVFIGASNELGAFESGIAGQGHRPCENRPRRFRRTGKEPLRG
jgi:hypothetical protein